MGRWGNTLAFVAVFMSICGWWTAARSSVPQPFSAAEELPGANFIRLANDPTAKRSDRAAAVFALFRQYVKPGHSLRQVHKILRDTAWVKEAKLQFYWLADYLPVDCNFEDRSYALRLFADNQGQSDWVIYFQLAGKSEEGKWVDDGVAFLCGKAGSKGESWLKEFVLYSPDGKIEGFLNRQ